MRIEKLHHWLHPLQLPSGFGQYYTRLPSYWSPQESFRGPYQLSSCAGGRDKFLWRETQCMVRAQAIDARSLRNSCTHFVVSNVLLRIK